jgi:hypothetical protein
MTPLTRMSPALVVLVLASPLPGRADEKPPARPVTVEEGATSFTLSNGTRRSGRGGGC